MNNKKYTRNSNVHIDWNELIRFCQVSDFSKLAGEYGAYELTGKGLHDTWFIDRGGGTLSVAHFDTVARGKPYPTKLIKVGKKVKGINSLALDDRLGAYILCAVLPRMGIYSDVLITTDEEIGRSTAFGFNNPADRLYNWIYSFDRHGDRPVAYEYEDDPDWSAAIEEVLPLDWGTFSDICDLRRLGVCGVNWGTAYHNEHSDKCRAYRDEIEFCVYAFSEFFWRNHSRVFPYSPRIKGKFGKGYRGGYYPYDDDENTGFYYNSRNWSSAGSAASGQVSIDPKSLQDRIDQLGTDKGKTWPLTGPESRTGADGEPEYLCEMCWQWDQAIAYSQTWSAWLCDDCVSELTVGLAGGG